MVLDQKNFRSTFILCIIYVGCVGMKCKCISREHIINWLNSNAFFSLIFNIWIICRKSHVMYRLTSVSVWKNKEEHLRISSEDNLQKNLWIKRFLSLDKSRRSDWVTREQFFNPSLMLTKKSITRFKSIGRHVIFSNLDMNQLPTRKIRGK